MENNSIKTVTIRNSYNNTVAGNIIKRAYYLGDFDGHR